MICTFSCGGYEDIHTGQELGVSYHTLGWDSLSVFISWADCNAASLSAFCSCSTRCWTIIFSLFLSFWPLLHPAHRSLIFHPVLPPQFRWNVTKAARTKTSRMAHEVDGQVQDFPSRLASSTTQTFLWVWVTTGFPLSSVGSVVRPISSGHWYVPNMEARMMIVKTHPTRRAANIFVHLSLCFGSSDVIMPPQSEKY